MLHAKFKLTTKNRIKREMFKKKNIQKYTITNTKYTNIQFLYS